MKNQLIFTAIAVGIIATACTAKVECSVPARFEGGTIVLDTPDREAGQQSALKMACEPIDTVRIGFIGIGGRGGGALWRYANMDGTRIVAICDKYQEKVDNGLGILEENGITGVDSYVGENAWMEMCGRDDIDLVYITTPWLCHTPMAVYAMEHGKHAVCEVPAATSIAECWQLVNTCEKTRKHFMMLENCCYDFFETSTLNMARQGLFGEILHVEGAYLHNLDSFWEAYTDNWRLSYNQSHRGDNYPTHGIGPVCQVLDIHRGDRMDYVVSMDTKSVKGAASGKRLMGVDEFADGDHTVSLIRTVNGKMIEIHHNVYSRRPYSRIHQLTGTMGMAQKYPDEHLAINAGNIPDGVLPECGKLDSESFMDDDLQERLLEAYKPDMIREIEDRARKVGGHGGMDYIMDYRLIYCLRNGLPLDEDVYDAAEWCCLTELSGLSINNGSAPVKVPDFTRGDWNLLQGLTFAE